MFEGTCIVVSHDRYFLNRVVDLLLVLDGKGNVQVIHGNYDTYEMMRLLQPPVRTGTRLEKRFRQGRKDPCTSHQQAGQTKTEICLPQSRGAGNADMRLRNLGCASMERQLAVSGSLSRRGQSQGNYAGLRGCEGSPETALSSTGKKPSN